MDKRKKGSTTYRERTALPALTAGRTAARENIVNGKKSRTGEKVQEKEGQQDVVTGRPQRSIEWAGNGRSRSTPVSVHPTAGTLPH